MIKSFLPILKTDTLLRSRIFKKSNFETKKHQVRPHVDCGRGASALELLFIKKRRGFNNVCFFLNLLKQGKQKSKVILSCRIFCKFYKFV